jgi:hypothetical protein
VHYPKSRIIHVGEIEVDYLRMATIHIAQWVTSRARYVALVDGDLPAVRKLISCTP